MRPLTHRQEPDRAVEVLFGALIESLERLIISLEQSEARGDDADMRADLALARLIRFAQQATMNGPPVVRRLKAWLNEEWCE